MEELLEKYHCDQSAAALERLVERYRPLAVSVCRRYLRSPHDVEDATQDALMRLASHAGSVPNHLRRWM